MGVFSTASGEAHAEAIVAACESTLLHDTVLECVAAGWLLSFGSSRDGGAVSVRVTNDDGRDGVWCGSTEELERALTAVQTAAKSATGTAGPERGSNGSTGPTAASRGKAAGGKGPNKSGA